MRNSVFARVYAQKIDRTALVSCAFETWQHVRAWGTSAYVRKFALRTKGPGVLHSRGSQTRGPRSKSLRQPTQSADTTVCAISCPVYVARMLQAINYNPHMEVPEQLV